MDDYIAPEHYTAAEFAELTRLMLSGGRRAVMGRSTDKVDKRIDELRARAVERERLAKAATAKAKAVAEAERAAAKAERREKSVWW